MANAKRRVLGLVSNKNFLRAKQKYLEAKNVLRAWKPKSREEYEKVYINALRYSLTRREAAQRGGLTDSHTLIELQSHELMQFIQRFVVNRALDAAGVSYHSKSGREFRRQVVKDFLRDRVSEGPVQRVYEKLGPVRLKIFISKLNYFREKVFEAGNKHSL